MLPTEALDYDLPPELIATRPVTPRDAARLLVLSRSDPARLEHRAVRDLPDLLTPGDRLVFNTTRVVPARFRGVREDTGGRVEGLYLADADEPGVWLAMIKSRRHREGATVRLLRGDDPSPVALELLGRAPDPPGAWRVRPVVEGGGDPPSALAILEAVGLTPLPPYILGARRAGRLTADDADDRERYQTVYADPHLAGSVAAPTAGLHFTSDLLDRLAARGVERTDVLLHVGAGTFKPVETGLVEDHPIHAEWCSADAAALAAVRSTRDRNRAVFAVGTTTVRTLESYAAVPEPRPDHLSTRLLITPGARFALTDGLLTNFHLPRSTLMALVGAMLQTPEEPREHPGEPVGVTRLKRAYAEAIRERYRFYSFGDAMLILP